MKKLLPILLLALTLPACTWVKLTPEGEKVRVASHEDVQSCERKGKTNASLKADIAGIDRKHEKVKTELETLARNSAYKLGGDTVVPVSTIKDGKQTFEVYRCNKP